ncbi:hypothetical protein H8957_017441, partial [Semnopithecus entellus]|uniref:Uncharacterized protein n=1 Tax=Rhinopithecus bieti TaxID=61621 RepID=A0A2K6JRT9_RHIBE
FLLFKNLSKAIDDNFKTETHNIPKYNVLFTSNRLRSPKKPPFCCIISFSSEKGQILLLAEALHSQYLSLCFFF